MLEVLLSTEVLLGIFFLILVALICNLIIKLAMVKAGIYKKYSKNRVCSGRLQGGLWTLGIALLVIVYMQLDISFWLAFWLLVALAGLIQIIFSFRGNNFL
ncbi:hypothetical protein PRVXH_000542 [Proteinivorax hydrogeniformans]|uniref:DUF3784 domain-containing protein n=1 Tax=Proteinivorax hydrogeniformans TaxID=1826727 RepID=A0AAU8HV39_9FIRM